MYQVANRIAWITGGGTGIGRALALRLAREGWQVAVSGRRPEPLDEVRLAASGLAGSILPLPVDVLDRDAMHAAAERIERELGPLHLVVLNAGTFQAVKPEKEFDAAVFEHHFDINVTGVINGIDAALPALKRRRSGHIVIVASVSGYRGLPLAAAYGASKAALINMAESLKFHFDRLNIVTSLAVPGFVDTPLTEKNRFPMPFLIDATEAAERIYRGIEKRAFEIDFPRRMSLVLKTFRMLPYALYFPLMKWITRR